LATSGTVVLKMPLSGGECVTLATSQHEIWTVTVDAMSVYWIEYEGAPVWDTWGWVMKLRPQ
jgi:hypothetical protein